MKTIRPFNNIPTVFHVTELPPFKNPRYGFGYQFGKKGENPALRVKVDLLVSGEGDTTIKVATYNSWYEIEGEGLILEDTVFACCQQAIYGMKIFCQFHEIGRSIPESFFQPPAKEAFEDDLVEVAKALNSIDGKRPFPPSIR